MTWIRETPGHPEYLVPMSPFGRRLYEVRVGRGMSAAALAERVRCPVWTVFAWEAGRELPNPRQIRDLARVFRVSEYALTAPAAAEPRLAEVPSARASQL